MGHYKHVKHDSRRKYLWGMIKTFFHCSADEQRGITEANEVTDFLDDPSCRILCLRRRNQDVLILDRSVVFEDDDAFALVFHKTSPEAITEATMRNKICFLNLLESPVSTFYHNLTNVFKPTISESQFWSRRLEPKLQNCMSELTDGLNSTINKSFGAFNKVKDVYTVDDELDVWNSQNWNNASEAKVVKSVRDVIAEISRELHQCVDANSGTDFLDGIQMNLQQLWGLGEESYPQARLIHLLDLIGTQVTQIVQNGIKHLKIWTDSFSKVESQLSWGIDICTKVNELCLKCTRTAWPRFDPIWRSYTLEEYVPAATSRYVKRLEELLRVRSVHREITYLVPISECQSLHPKKAFAPFQGINIIFSNSHTDKAFDEAVKAFDLALIPAEAKLSVKLRAKLGVKLSNAQLMLEFKRYSQLIERPKVAHDVQSQREQMLIIYRDAMKDYLKEVETGEYLGIGGINSTEVNDIFNIRQIFFKGKELEDIAKKTMSDLEDYPALQEQFTQFTAWVEQLQDKLFGEWRKTVNERVLGEGLALKDGTPVIDFNQDSNFMEVNYSKKLHSLIGDASQLTLMGFRLSEDISTVVCKAGLFVKQANELDQIASFHNTIGDRMVRSQRPMMLDTALALSELVSSQNAVSWKTIREVEDYISNFRSIVRRLSRQNNYLCQIHLDIVTKVETLFQLDILSEMPKWKTAQQDIVKIISDVEAEGYRSIKSWKNHWNHQIYKGFEVAYVRGLKIMDTKLPIITVDVIYSQQKLQLKPALEDLTALYWNLIRKFLSIPQQFTGIKSDEADTLFSSITLCNAELFPDIYLRSIAILKDVLKSKDKYDKWVAIGSADVGSLCDQFLHTAQDWDRNFKDCRSNVVESGRVQFLEESLPPFRISSKTLRIDVDSMNRKYFETLGDTLLNSTNSEVSALETFLKSAVRALDVMPMSADDIVGALDILQIIQFAEEHVTRTYESILSKNKVIVTWVKSQVDTMSIQKLLMNYQSLARSFDSLILRQVNSVRTQIDTEFETLSKIVTRFKQQWDLLQGKGGDGKAEMTQIMTFINEQQADWVKITAMNDRISQISKKLNLPVRSIPAVEEIEKEIALCEEIWQQVDSFNLGLRKFESESWLTFRSSHFRFEEFLQNWIDEFKSAQENGIVANILAEIKSYQKLLPNIKYIRGDSFAEKHWSELYQILKMPPRPFSTLTLGDFLAVRFEIESNFKELKTLNRNAAGEVTVRQALDELDTWEIEAQFSFVENLDSQKKAVQIIHDFKSVLNKVGDNQSLLQSIKSSPFFNRFADRITSWEVKMTDLDLFLTSLSKIQRRWIYLEPVFSHGVLDNEQTRFKRIDKDFRGILDSLAQTNRVSTLLRINGIRGILANMLDQLGRCQNSLNEFLERKRSGFPRFYFLGDDDLLEILGQSTKPSVIQSHLKKLFGGIYNVDFDAGFENIRAMKSQEGEVVELKCQVKIRPNVEEWLSELAQEMKTTLKALTLECVSQKRNKKRDPDMFPSQILALCNCISFTSRCEESIRNGKLDAFLAELRQELESYTSVKISKDHPNPKVIELKLKDLILDLIYQIDTVEYLLSTQLMSVTDFGWQKQLRFYVTEEGDVSVRMADAEFSYSYEYQGNAPKLVHTPLTNKCYLTLTQGMRIGLGGNPFGPAGTGKTESVKALAGLLGRQVLVFNCDEGIDVKAMGRIFIGLVKCGAWGCFDEFNRLDAATLSAVSMQIQPIQTALKHGDKTVRLMDETVSLDPNTGIFVTLNPAGKGYGGRNELPDNLKQLFRPVAMTSPNYDLISEVILYTEGFHKAKTLGNKLVEIFNLASGLLTPQKHYDWGLRALKTVLKGCGNTLRNFREQGLTPGDQDEVDIVVSALRLNTLPKLPYLDALRFNSLIKDLFGDVVFKDLGHDELEQHVRASFEELKLHINENQVRKCLQLYEQLEQRMGVVIVGPPLSGKSTICAILKHALIRMKVAVKTSTINPKAMQKSQLLGHINVDTRQWSDGVLTLKAQEVYNEREDVRSWIICDGDIDPEWIESLNSVLDDNRMLTLPSGWRIKFGPNVNFLFETHDLSYASPATVSRMGMILTSEEDADVNGVISSWLELQPTNTRSKIEDLIKQYFHRGIDWIAKSETTGGTGCQLPLVSKVKNGLSHLPGVVTVPQMAIAMVRGIGCHLDQDLKLQFTKAVLEWTDLRVEGNLANLTYSDEKQRLVCFDDVDLHDVSQGVKVTAPPLVKTANVKQTLAHIRPWMQNSDSFLLVGKEGCGKTMILEYAFGEMRDVEIATIHCSSLITPQHVLQKMSQVCISKSSGSGREYIAKNGGRLILYFKDLNLVKPDKWGTCQLVEFLHQVITHQGFYDANLEWIWLKNVQIIASITLGSSDGRYALSPRFTSNIRYCTVTEPLREQLIVIYKTYLTLSLKSLHPDSAIAQSDADTDKVVLGMIAVYEEVSKAFPRSRQNHYQFTSRDLTNWVFGMMRYDLDATGASSVVNFIQIWAHEACRLFRDRLVSADERASFDEILENVVHRVWGSKDAWSHKGGLYFISGYAQLAASSSLAVITHAPGSAEKNGKLSKASIETVENAVEKGLAQFARDYRSLNIVTFSEVLDNVAHFDRILSAPSSSIVLTGRAGIGRRTALSIVASLHGAMLYTLKVGQHYGVKNFKNDLKSAIRLSAIEGTKVFLVVEDYQLTNEVFLDMLNGLLSSGEVPSLYTPEELEVIMSGLREVADEEGYSSSILSYFVKRIRDLLHVILIMDHTNNSFQNNCERNPALYKNCSLLWLDSWSQESLRVIPKLIISKFYAEKLGEDPGTSKNDDSQLTDTFKSIYASLTPHMASPRRFIALIHTYGLLYMNKRGKIQEKISELKAGVQKLDEARAVVQNLRTDASAQEVVLAGKKEQTSKSWDAIMLGMQTTHAQEAHVKELQAKTVAENDIMLVKKQSIDNELQQIQPMLLEAQMSVGNLSNDALNEIRSLRAPPETIKDILVGVLSLMGIQDTSWTSMKSFLGRRGVKEELRNFDSKKIKASDRKGVEDILKKHASSFEPENAKRASRAAAPLAAWVIANVNYSQVLERIEPLMTQQSRLEMNLANAKAQIEELTVEKQRVSEENERLKADLEVTNKEVAELEVTLAKVKKTLVSAEALVEKLQDEFVRWTAEASALGIELESLPMKCILAAAFVTYLCDADENERINYVKSWLHLVQDNDTFEFCDFMSTEQEVLSFQSLGLPSDKLSQENAIIIMQTSLRPYLIDPSSRATEWLKAYLEKNGHITVNISLRDQKFSHELELAVRFGKALIIHEMDEIDPILMPILRGDFISQGSRDTVQIGDKFVDYNSDFKLFMTTRNPSPILPPDSAAVVTIVNFTTTRAGLTTQLLSTTLSFEKPELETRKTELLKQTDEMKQDLNKLGTQLLKELASATGNILENQELLNSLQQTKTKSNEINMSLAQKKAVEETLNKEINVYLPLAEFGSLLFFAILDVPKLNRLYKISLACFIQLFRKTLGSKYEGKQSTERRIRSLETSLEQLVYEYVCQSLFKGDRLAFALHLTHAMHPEVFQKQEWELFIGQLSGGQHADIPTWIPEDRQSAIGLLSTHFSTLFRNLQLETEMDWMNFMNSTECENCIPAKALEALTPFQILLAIQALRPDRLFTAMSLFAKTILNRKSLFPPPTSFRELLDDTVAKEPILILIAPGADPSQELRELGEAAVGPANYAEISMGKEEPEVVLERIKEAADGGKWLCLKNLHLVTHWLDSLEKEIQRLKPHPDFRLWLISEPHDNFPIILAETCLKVAYESPEGLKKNLQRTYTNWSKEYVSEGKNLLRMQALFVLAFFHAIVQERRTYIPQGWSKFYEFNESDLRAGAEILDNVFKSSRGKKIQWAYIRGVYENAIYGGRVDNEFDLRILVSYLDNFFNDEVLSGSMPSRQILAPGLQLPLRENYQDFMKILENFPDYDRPAMFGLPVNIERSWQRTTSTLVINQLKNMARQFLEEGQFHTALWSNEMNPILAVWKKFNQANSTTNLLSQKVTAPGLMAKDKELDPLENFVLLEQHNILDLHQFVHKTLAGISKIGRGHVTPTQEMIEVFKSLSKREVPAIWSRIWEGPQETKAYLSGVVTKVVSIQSWVSQAQQDKLLNMSLNLADLLHPVSFLSAFKQHCARKQNLCMDELAFVCFWKRTTLKAGIPSCRLTGLYLEGCSFDGSKLTENTPESPHVSKVPDCTIAWVPLATVEEYRKGTTLSVPLYYNEQRLKMITCLEFPTEGPKAKWIQTGLGLFLKPT